MARVKATWTDSRGSMHAGWWENGKFTGARVQYGATVDELERNPHFVLPGRGPEIVTNADPWPTDPFVWFKPNVPSVELKLAVGCLDVYSWD